MEGIRCGVRYGPVGREAVGDGGARTACRGGLDCRYGAGHGEERTLNMLFMVVTLEVSQLDISALNPKGS